MRERPAPPGLRRFQKVEPFVLVTPQTLPQELKDGRLARAGFAGQLEKGEALLLQTDLLDEQGTKKKGEGRDALPVERLGVVRQPVRGKLPGRVDLDSGEARLDALFPDFKVIMLIDRDFLASAVGVFLEDIGFQLRHIADVRHGTDLQDFVSQPVAYEVLEVPGRAVEGAAARLAQEGLVERLRLRDGAAFKSDCLFGCPVAIIDLKHVPLFVHDCVTFQIQKFREDVGNLRNGAVQPEHVAPAFAPQIVVAVFRVFPGLLHQRLV